jgi:hypothetical protein
MLLPFSRRSSRRNAVGERERVRAFGDCAGRGWESHFPTGKGRRAGSPAFASGYGAARPVPIGWQRHLPIAHRPYPVRDVVAHAGGNG